MNTITKDITLGVVMIYLFSVPSIIGIYVSFQNKNYVAAIAWILTGLSVQISSWLALILTELKKIYEGQKENIKCND